MLIWLVKSEGCFGCSRVGFYVECWRCVRFDGTVCGWQECVVLKVTIKELRVGEVEVISEDVDENDC